MEIIESPGEMKKTSARWRREGLSIGFVPTMGYLHEGHLTLIRASRAKCDRTVASIFVNPTQFGPNEDFEKYPRDPQHDRQLLEGERCDLLFAPDTGGMYPEGARTFVEVLGLQDGLCGRSRPGHFRGVATVVAKLFNLVVPDVAFFGQKDAQQVIIIKRMVKELMFPIEIVVCPTVRAPDGLAMSSRNAYLTSSERARAPALYRGLREAEGMFHRGERRSEILMARIRKEILDAGLDRIDYIETVDAESLAPVGQISRPALVALAVHAGKARLIDNIFLIP